MRNRLHPIPPAAVAIVLCIALLASLGCQKKDQKPSGMPPAPVAVGHAEQRDVPVQIRVIGTVEASSSVAVKAQVGGVLTRVHFVEGQDVNKGAVLFSIDPRPYEAALRQAEAALVRSRAQYENAKAEEKRYAELLSKGYVAQTQYEQIRTNADALNATVQGDQAAVENAKLNLNYCTIRSPFSGRTGNLMVDEGNLIKANADTAMVTIHQIRPVYVAFSVPEQSLDEIRTHMTAGVLKVEAFASQEDKTPARGRLTFIDNTVDVATGTILLKGTFDNSDRRLWPGQFVNVVMTLVIRKNATVVPTAAVQTGQQGPYVFVLKGDTAELHPVTIGTEYEGMTVIEKGVQAGDVVVTSGHMRVIPGGSVVVKGGEGHGIQSTGQGGAGKAQGAGGSGQDLRSTGNKEGIKAEPQDTSKGAGTGK